MAAMGPVAWGKLSYAPIKLGKRLQMLSETANSPEMRCCMLPMTMSLVANQRIVACRKTNPAVRFQDLLCDLLATSVVPPKKASQLASQATDRPTQTQNPQPYAISPKT